MRYGIFLIMWTVWVFGVTIYNASTHFSNGSAMGYGVAIKGWFVTFIVISCILMELFTIWFVEAVKSG